LGGIPPADLPAEVSTQAGPSQFRSDIFKQTPPIFKLRLLGDCCLAPPEAGLGFGEDFEGIFEVAKQFLPA